MNETVKDEYELKLEAKAKELLECQKSHELKSCYTCPKVLECELRTAYVDASYGSMAKGDTGGFDF